MTDHRGFVFNLKLKKYFDIKESKYNKNIKRTLNLNNQVYRAKLKDKIIIIIRDLNLLQKVARIWTNRVTLHDINTVDNEMIYTLNAAKKYVEGPRSNIPYSKEK